MKIARYEESFLEFDNGSTITGDYEQDCCEHNYIDFEQLEETALNHDFYEGTFKIIPCEYGFRFGDHRRTFFVPCYSNQNGYYNSNINIIYRKKSDDDKCCVQTTEIECLIN